MSEPNSFDDFMDRFDELCHEALRYGIASVVALEEHNILQNQTVFKMGYHGGASLCLGMFVRSSDKLKRILAEDSED